MPIQIIYKPGAVATGGTITLPPWEPPIWRIIAFAVMPRASVAHEACGATGAKYPSATALATSLIGHVPKAVVDVKPATGQV